MRHPKHGIEAERQPPDQVVRDAEDTRGDRPEAASDLHRQADRAEDLAGDQRIQALQEIVRSPLYRKALGELPGYDSTETGQLQHVT